MPDHDISRMDTTKDVTDYDPPSLLTPHPINTFNQTTASGFVERARDQMFESPLDSDPRPPLHKKQIAGGKLKAKRQLNKTFTDF